MAAVVTMLALFVVSLATPLAMLPSVRKARRAHRAVRALRWMPKRLVVAETEPTERPTEEHSHAA